MCSIMGYCGASADYERFMEGFEKTISRGPDDSRVVDTGNGYLGFHRLAIMGLTTSGMQPFSLGSSYVVCKKKEMLFISLFWYFYCCPLVNDRY